MQARLVSLLTTQDRMEMFVRGERCATYRYAEGQIPGFVSLSAPGERLITQPNADGLGMWLTCEGKGKRVKGKEEESLLTLDSQLSTPSSFATIEMTARRGAYSVGFQHECAWLNGAGERLLTDTRTVRVAPGPSEGAILDIALRLQAEAERGVSFAPSQGGLLCLRVASGLFDSGTELIGGGQIRNNRGEYGMAALHGRQAKWCAGAGVIQGETVGFAFLEHPHNPYFPSPWIARADGLLSPSPFGWRSLTLAPGDRLDLRYRILIYMGYVNQGWADARLQDFAREV